ncbi:squamous cell carcinoma antigen recognized by T-cells 3 [Corythoichthys intestinalis]|uniref:squamous cell carcinoma antigen recognized by T-cells 3 n=1 Tax=Corythoichthys intestinalis TaxID=161448 RepID=UPI0025A514B1|nr:squamous cell carcinoma antigen recognized by T-cells 3 [Corythoichthys intestinalis]XP_061804101.1 squamous cell carcinoma antigen recognized by T-cells 3-like [Nerophis lumbriciformis]
MAAASNAEPTHLQDMEEDDAEMDEREMDSESDGDEGMRVDNSDDDEDDTSEDEKENEAEIQRLEEQLSINAFDYNCHVDLIKLLKHEGELLRLRKARQKMSELFPLTEEIWLDWLKDEIRMTEEESNREKVNELFEKAIKDYICPDIWLEYAQYSIGGMGSPGGIDRVRSIFERAITAVGLHMTKGQTVWEAYREFENVILATVQPPPGKIPSRDEQELLNKQLQRIHTLFRRQLAIPLMDMEATYAEYEEWSDEGTPEKVLHQYKSALQLKEKYKPFEESLLVAETPKLAEYQSYIDFEMKEGDPARIQMAFERTLVENCLVPDMWTKYTTYLDRQLKIKDLVLSTHDRAVRNCPWTMSLWKSYLQAAERHGGSHQTVSDLFEKALNAGFIQATDYVEIWQVYLDYLRRRVDFSQESSKELEELRGSFTRCLDYIKQDVEERFGESGDPSCNIMQIWARIEALHCKNIQKARELWDSIMTKGNAKYANMWLEYYNLERAYGDSAHCRKALHRAVQCTSDYPEHVCEVLLTFERVEGSLEDWDVAVQKTETRLNRVNEQRAKVAEKEAIQAQHEEEQLEQRRKARAEKKTQKKVLKRGQFVEKRKAEHGLDQDEWIADAEQAPKRHKGNGEQSKEEQMETEIGLSGKKPPPGYKASAPALPKAQQASGQNTSDDKRELRNDDSSVFVSNLSYTLQEPEAILRTLFETCGPIKQIRLVSSNKGTFKGYGYVQFESSEAVSEALKLDRQQVEGRPVFVSPCVDKNKNPDFKVFKYNTAMEKHKIFIHGLPFSCTKEQLEEISKQHGAIKEVRLVTFRSGKPKGLAYVEFANEAQASQAVLKMDGMYIEGKRISVAISNPPRRHMSNPGGSSQIETLELPPLPSRGARGRGRTQLSLLPRSLNRQSGPESKVENGTACGEGSGDAKPLSNADFAKMLLQK